ncbi:MAG: amidohydrolase family protein [Chloroflexota bacterium]|nr:amidohydrolase family protein [Chloroflexota bacterium]
MTTKTGYLVIDSDAHVVETERTWDFMDAEDAAFRPKLVQDLHDPTRQHWVIEGEVRGFRFPTLTEMQQEARSQRWRNITTPQAARELDDVALRLEDMDRLGIDVQVLHHTLWIEQVAKQPEVELAICRGWNRWVGDVSRKSGGRLRWACVPPYSNLEASLEILEEAKANGAVAVTMRPIEGERTILDQYFYPIYEQAIKLNMAVAVHIANANPGIVNILRTPEDPGSAFGIFRIPTVAACHALIMSKIPERFPELRWGFIEASAGWVPWIITESRNRYMGAGRRFPDNVLKECNIYVTCQTDDDIPYILSCAGDDNILIGTDYGHFDPSSEVDAISVFKGMDGISDESMRKILSDNPKALYGIE